MPPSRAPREGAALAREHNAREVVLSALSAAELVFGCSSEGDIMQRVLRLQDETLSLVNYMGLKGEKRAAFERLRLATEAWTEARHA